MSGVVPGVAPVAGQADRRRARVGIAAAWIGTGAIALGSLLAAVAYGGRAGEAYSPVNHFVSELGEPGVSALAAVFNAGLMVGGAGFVVFMAMLACSLDGRLRWLWGPVGVAAGVGGFLVGVFPMDHIAQHTSAAMAFFNLGWIAVALASLDIARRRDPRFPRWLALVGLATVAAFIGFLVEVSRVPPSAGHILASPADRPAFWLLTTLEWAVIVGILAWTFLTATTWWRVERAA